MTDNPTLLLLLLGSGVSFVVVVLLWKLLLTTAGIAAAQWLIVTGFADSPAVQALALVIPALLAAVALQFLPRLTTRSARPPFASRLRARGHRQEVNA